jgi:hypothetical protein
MEPGLIGKIQRGASSGNSHEKKLEISKSQIVTCCVWDELDLFQNKLALMPEICSAKGDVFVLLCRNVKSAKTLAGFRNNRDFTEERKRCNKARHIYACEEIAT